MGIDNSCHSITAVVLITICSCQFEPDMVKICMKILDMNNNHGEDPAKDVSSRCDPIYVGRVVSAMV